MQTREASLHRTINSAGRGWSYKQRELESRLESQLCWYSRPVIVAGMEADRQSVFEPGGR